MNRWVLMGAINVFLLIAGFFLPPVGLNLYVINGIAPDIKLKTILKGSLPYVGCMIVAIVLLCIFPGLATWLPNAVMGPGL